MKIILWIGNAPNQKALANKLHEAFPITGIVLETRPSKTKVNFSLFIEKVIEKTFLSSIGKAWMGMLNKYKTEYPSFPNTALIDVENINSDDAYHFTNKLNPDLILVSGTRLVNERMLQLKPTIGILNLHTGISPYVKGGPNCTNWCLANKDYHLIGNTIMWIDKGIDSGNILTTELTPLDGNENLKELHFKVMEHAHALYIKAVKFIGEQKTQSIKQSDIAKGKTFYNKDWNLIQKMKLVIHFTKFKKYSINGDVHSKQKTIKTIPLSS
ncbi:MAG: formyltransferase family protein [Cytophagaceae bacterium]